MYRVDSNCIGSNMVGVTGGSRVPDPTILQAVWDTRNPTALLHFYFFVIKYIIFKILQSA